MKYDQDYYSQLVVDNHKKQLDQLYLNFDNGLVSQFRVVELARQYKIDAHKQLEEIWPS